MKKYIITLYLLIGSVTCLISQIKTSYRAEVFGSAASGENTPFWMMYHNWGMVPLTANNFYARAGVFHDQKINKDWSFSAGLDVAGSSPHSYGNVWIQQLYGELNWKALRLNIGAKEDYFSMLDRYLSSGDFTNSNNARPLPEIKLSLTKFVLVPYTKGNMYIKGDFSIGKYLDGQYLEDIAKPYFQDYVKGILAHHKSIYFRFGNIEKKNKLQFTFGLDHQAQWGGYIYCYTGDGHYDVQKQPNGLTDLLRVMIAKEGASGSSGADQAYVSGSQVGAYLFKFDYRLKNNNIISLYLNHFFDDGSGMTFENYRDGLYGIEYMTQQKSLISGIVAEFIYTKQQTGAIHFNLQMDDAHRDLESKGNGNDNYYNNCDYVQGPSYFGRTKGTPLLLSPEYNDYGQINFNSSRIKAFHLGLEGYFCQNLQYRLLATKGQTWGRYYRPYISVREGIASNLDLIYNCRKIKDLDLKLSVGFNKGDFFEKNTFGGGITITKRGILFEKD